MRDAQIILNAMALGLSLGFVLTHLFNFAPRKILAVTYLLIAFSWIAWGLSK